jgi:hypothetical protein
LARVLEILKKWPTTTMVLIFLQPQIPIFKGENYGFWSIKMKTLFLSQELWDLVENGYTEPTNAQAIVGLTQVQRDQLREN